MGQHDHTVDDPGHGHTINDTGHGHTATDSGHSHTNAVIDTGHTHSFELHDEGGEGYVDDSGSDKRGDEPTSSSVTGISVNINTGYASIAVGSNTSNISLVNNTTGLTVDNAGSVADTNAPYIQLLVCQKD